MVGAGPAGLQAALTAQRGHSVTLFERGEDIGGLQFRVAAPVQGQPDGACALLPP
ncbi:MAG: NAD(P)-binding protein [Bilophila wadsworthia]